MIPTPGTPASDRLQQITRWGLATATLQRLRTRLTDHEIFPRLIREDSRPHLLIGEALTVWTGYNGEVVYWSPEPGIPVENAPASDLAGAARRIAELVYAEPAPVP
ncbi:hypothetical protein AB0D67_33940 [Streptosporangium sp. NPDC048047]|uniref:hypothetical protein n=1 Tax=unclassified Streptosporangium TaxID=2632669 RepID=UPI003447F82A